MRYTIVFAALIALTLFCSVTCAYAQPAQGHVMDVKGQPISGATVNYTWYYWSSDYSKRYSDGNRQTQSDTNGNFSCTCSCSNDYHNELSGSIGSIGFKSQTFDAIGPPGTESFSITLAPNEIVNPSLPVQNFLLRSFPNPLFQSTTIRFSGFDHGFAEISINNLIGAEVARLY
jgi:hypothetical protein